MMPLVLLPPLAALALSLLSPAAVALSDTTAVPAGKSAPVLISSAADARWADSVLATLTVRQRAAQMVWPNLIGDYVPTDAEQWRRLSSYITEDRVGGLLVSVGSPIEIAAKLNALQRLSALPLLVSADLETGAGMRARGGYFTPNGINLGGAAVFPPNMALGAARDSALAYEEGRITAIEGRALGIHVNFAPVVDVNNNPANPVINVRSYSEDPRLVARMGTSFIRGLQENGMIATAKHFPGHGDTGTNSHLALPVVTVSRARLDSVELVPFRAAIRAGVGAVMTFHGVMPALDSSGVPGTLSRKVLTGLLRNELGFRGLVVSDAMDMRGVLDQFGAVEAVKRGVAAGLDVLIQPVEARVAINAIMDGLREGRYTEARITESARRILLAKRALGLDRQRFVSLDSLRKVVGDSANVAATREVAERSITLVRDSLRVLPLTPAAAPRVLSITLASRFDLGAGATFDAELRRVYPKLRTVFVDADNPLVAYTRVAALADSADVTVVGSYIGQRWNVTTVSAPEAFASFVKGLRTAGRRPILVAFGNPYLLQQVPSVPAYMVAWSGSDASQQAAARALLGSIPVVGRLPISIPPYVPLGAGLTLPAAPGTRVVTGPAVQK